MKIAYIFYAKLQYGDGVFDKIISQIKVWRELGHDVLPVIFALDDPNTNIEVDAEIIDYRKFSKINLITRLKALLKMKRCIDGFNPDVIYSRCGSISPIASLFIRTRKHVVEVNTEPQGETKAEALHGVLANRDSAKKLKRQLDSIARADGIVSVTYGILNKIDCRVPSIVIPNSVVVNNLPFRTDIREDCSERLPILLFIGSPKRLWHGTGRLLALARSTVGKLEYIIVGTDLQDVEIPPNVEVKGYLGGDELSRVMEKVDVGVSTMALYAKDHTEACPLKVRSYAAMGLPMIIPYKETAFLELGVVPDWALEVSNQDGFQVGEIDEIVKFALVWKGRRIPESAARRYFGSDRLESKRVNFFAQIASIHK